MNIERVYLDENALNDLPEKEAVYVIGKPLLKERVPARVVAEGKKIEWQYVGETDDLQRRTKEHFGKGEKNPCLREFMQSDKEKLMDYELMPGSTEEERQEKEEEWKEKFEPECQPKLVL